jgi:hypothetical protein
LARLSVDLILSMSISAILVSTIGGGRFLVHQVGDVTRPLAVPVECQLIDQMVCDRGY